MQKLFAQRQQLETQLTENKIVKEVNMVHSYVYFMSSVRLTLIYIGLTILTIRSDDSHANYPPVFL